MSYLTVRNLPPDVAQALQQERRRRGTSLNQTVIDLLRRSLGVHRQGRRSNGLARLAGTWTEDDFHRFQEAISITEEIDEEVWR